MNLHARSILERSCLGYGLKPEYCELLLAMAKEASFHSSEEFIRHGAKDADLYVVLEGHIKAITDDGDQLFEIGIGGVVGEIAFLDGGPRAANATAINPVTALRFPAGELRRAMCSDKDFGFAVLANLSRLVCARLRNADERLDALMDQGHQLWNTADR